MESIKIETFPEEKLTKSTPVKKYWRVKTNKGFCSIWDEKVVKGLAQRVGEEVLVNLEVSADGKYKTIRELGAVAQTENKQIEDEEVYNAPQMVENNNTQKTTLPKEVTMLTSYSKDIFLHLLGRIPEEETGMDLDMIMDRAIELVKRAYNEFK